MFNGNHSKMNYTDSVEDLMIFSPQYAQADDGSWARQLKMTGQRQTRHGDWRPLHPLLLSGPWLEAALEADLGVGALSVAQFQGPRADRTRRKNACRVSPSCLG